MAGLGTKFFGVSNRGVIAGDYLTQANLQSPVITHAFLLDENRTTPIDFAGAAAGGFGVQVTGVNTSREAVGAFTAPTGQLRAFFWKAGNFFSVDYPGAPYNEGHSIITIMAKLRAATRRM